MRSPYFTRIFTGACIAGAVLCMTTACSGTDDDQESLEATSDEAKDKDKDQDKAKAKGGEDDETQAVTQPREEVAESPPAEEAKSASEQAPPPAPDKIAAVMPAPAQQVAQPAAGAGRVLRYVKTEGLDIHTQASASSPSAGQLAKGDRVIVSEENGWGKMNDGMYVQMDKLSSKAVARSRQAATWNPPAH